VVRDALGSAMPEVFQQRNAGPDPQVIGLFRL
jgi:hypothetical protein